jgi:hypothetical protein
VIVDEVMKLRFPLVVAIAPQQNKPGTQTPPPAAYEPPSTPPGEGA